MTMTELLTMSTSGLIREALDKSNDPDPRAIAEVLLDRLQPSERDEMLLDLIRWYASTVAGRMRQESVKPRGENNSKKWASARSIMENREYVNGEWKKLKDLDVADLKWLAADRTKAAASYLNAADAFSRLAKLLKNRGASVVGQLTDDEVVEALSHDS